MLRALIALLLFLPAAALANSNNIVAVLYFENQGNEELEPLKVGLAEMMIADLQGQGEYKVVERGKLEAILAELELSRSDLADPAHALKVSKLLNANWYVTGGYQDVLGSFQLSARMFSTETSEIVWSELVRGKAREFVDLEQQLSAKVVRELQTQHPPTDDGAPGEPAPATAEPDSPRRGDGESGKAPAPTEPVPSATADASIVREDADTMAAAISFSEGLIYMDGKDMERARDSFAKAVEEDPGFDAAKDKLASLEL